ncbi:hypothetical protein [Wolbachia endosymbiont of Pentidionis agamae]|uniref:hypothetical protein n=1 Tax=Wolbachia endosymbiont of Pentidionis agamae TaxID=3110435 RepID=UPI002FCE91B0
MKVLLHDASRLMCSLSNILLSVTNSGRKKLKNSVLNYLNKHFITRDEFESFMKNNQESDKK